jgi:hypothetical protein
VAREDIKEGRRKGKKEGISRKEGRRKGKKEGISRKEGRKAGGKIVTELNIATWKTVEVGGSGWRG